MCDRLNSYHKLSFCFYCQKVVRVVHVPSLAWRPRYVLSAGVLKPSRSCVDEALRSVHTLPLPTDPEGSVLSLVSRGEDWSSGPEAGEESSSRFWPIRALVSLA